MKMRREKFPGNRRPVAQTCNSHSHYSAMRREEPPHLGETTKDTEMANQKSGKGERRLWRGNGHPPHGAVSVSANTSAGRATPEGGPRLAPRGLKTTTSEL